jgi:hypothetical protein
MIDIESLTDSKLRLFLSVDIGGSTALKNKKNHTRLLDTYDDRKKTLERLSRGQIPASSQEENENMGGQEGTSPEVGSLRLLDFTLDDTEKCIKTILYDWAIEVFDWATILQYWLSEFHGDLFKVLEEVKEIDTQGGIDKYFWKAVGDELIYVFDIDSPEQIHHLVVSFLKVVRQYDSYQVAKDQVVRFKASGWTAGFPVRNRRIRFRGPKLYTADVTESANRKAFATKECSGRDQCVRPEDCHRFTEYQPEKTDYLGPDIDAGFRIGDHAHPGIMVISMDLAEMLGRAPEHLQQVRGAMVGWEKLKGVWNGSPYPIIWATLPENLDSTYDQFKEWSSDLDRFSRKWQSQCKNGLKQIKHLTKQIERTRSQLPDSLGLVKPYIISESSADKRPPKHDLILEIINHLYLGDAGAQKEEDWQPPRGPSKSTTKAQNDIDQIASLDPERKTDDILFRRFSLGNHVES